MGVCFWYFQMIPLTRSLGEEWTCIRRRQLFLLARVTFVHACVTCIFSGESLWGAWKWSWVGTVLLMQQAHSWRYVCKCFPCQLVPLLWRVTVVRSREALFVIRESHVSWFFVFQTIPLASSFGEAWTWTHGKHVNALVRVKLPRFYASGISKWFCSFVLLDRNGRQNGGGKYCY